MLDGKKLELLAKSKEHIIMKDILSGKREKYYEAMDYFDELRYADLEWPSDMLSYGQRYRVGLERLLEELRNPDKIVDATRRSHLLKIRKMFIEYGNAKLVDSGG